MDVCKAFDCFSEDVILQFLGKPLNNELSANGLDSLCVSLTYIYPGNVAGLDFAVESEL